MVATRRLSLLVDEIVPRLEIPSGPVVVALSGGADSAALAYLVKSAGHELSALHVHHGLPASERLQVAAVEIAATLEVDLEVDEVEVPGGPSPEGQARMVRYQMLESVAGPVVTAHTRDDSSETMLINLTRGTGPAGLAGIPRHRPPNIYRPLLEVGRDQTREIAALAGLPFVDDPSNDDLTITRNRLRHRVMPLLREINPRVDEALARAAAALREDHDLLDELTPEIGDEPVVASAVVATLPRPIADRLLAALIAASGLEVTAERIGKARAVLDGTSARQELGEGIVARMDGALLRLE